MHYHTVVGDVIFYFAGVWGVQATEHMVQIYLSPDNDPLWAERDSDTAATPEAVADALRVAKKLLDDVAKQDRTPVHQVWRGWRQMCRGRMRAIT